MVPLPPVFSLLPLVLSVFPHLFLPPLCFCAPYSISLPNTLPPLNLRPLLLATLSSFFFLIFFEAPTHEKVSLFYIYIEHSCVNSLADCTSCVVCFTNPADINVKLM